MKVSPAGPSTWYFQGRQWSWAGGTTYLLNCPSLGSRDGARLSLRFDVKPSQRNILSWETGVSGFTVSWLCGERHFAFPGGFNYTSYAGKGVKHNCTNKRNSLASRRHSFRLLDSKPAYALATVSRFPVYKYVSYKKAVNEKAFKCQSRKPLRPGASLSLSWAKPGIAPQALVEWQWGLLCMFDHQGKT